MEEWLSVDAPLTMSKVSLALKQLQDVVSTLSRPTPAAPDEEVTEAMIREGESKAFEYAANMATERQKVLAIYAAMRAAAPNAQAEYEARHPEEPATPLGDAAWWRAQFEHEVHMRARLEEQLEAALARPAPTPEPRLAYVPQGAPGTGAYIVEGEMLEALNALPKLRAENAELRARLELANKTKLQTMDDYHALQAEVAALRSLRDSVWSLGDTAQWRMRAEQRGYMVFCNAQDCADIADIQEELAALDAAEGEGR